MWNYCTIQVYKKYIKNKNYSIFVLLLERRMEILNGGIGSWPLLWLDMSENIHWFLSQEWNWSFGFMSKQRKSECVDAFDQVRRWGSSAGQFQKSFYCNVMKKVWPPPSSTFQVYYWFWLCTLSLGIGSAGGVWAAPSQILWCRFWGGGFQI